VLTEDEALMVKGLGLLTLKPLIYAANVSEDDLGNHGANNVHVQVSAATVGPKAQDTWEVQHVARLLVNELGLPLQPRQ
jgi:ribosome-binding ATPase YchF (GTP1/OBG family)